MPVEVFGHKVTTPEAVAVGGGSLLAIYLAVKWRQNSAAAANIARLGSLGRAHSEHRSTVKNRMLAPGLACASRAARVSPATPPPQPSPKIGTRERALGIHEKGLEQLLRLRRASQR